MTEFWQFVLIGLVTGLLYALIAIGYTMVYGIIELINFAHGEVFMAGAFGSFFFATAYGASGFLNRHAIPALAIPGGESTTIHSKNWESAVSAAAARPDCMSASGFSGGCPAGIQQSPDGSS